jgi:hypothetical protein
MTNFTKDFSRRQLNEYDKVLVPRVTYEEATVTGGFGCNPDGSGSAVFVKFSDGERDRIERHQILGVEE